MPSAQDFLNAVHDVSNKLDQIKGKLDTANNHLATIEASVQQSQQLLLWGFQQMITLGQYTNQALFHNDQQNDTMICLLQEIAVNTCGIWNEAHTQTPLQEAIKAACRRLADLYAATHGEAAVTLEREEELRRQIEACCPPEPPAPVCVEKPCATPRPFETKPPKTDPPPKGGAGPIG
jgi:hypothetical protein